ncbi:DinB family protein [Hymenobacter sp. 5516J-16]|uniref:DinB family protein n=1 Tax=Hymenobacter sp. 5516J-16 TaxID=2932253 RepID=UPI001FD04FF5|nr:DinB family protein [Hymenobacter sp. 5516J-16]UOQ76872.1 DinB family protein [Hymenobacter sp. 5516J-16]
MNHRLHLRFEQLERATTQLFHSVEALGDKARQAPGPGQWSAVQVVQHLVVAETGIGQYMEKKLLQAEGLHKAGFASFLKSRLLRVLLRLPFTRFKAPAALAKLTPAEIPPLSELQAEWEAVRRRLERLLNEYPSNLLDRAIFKHPRSGMLTIYQTLDFMLDHVLHHQKQVERITKAVALNKTNPALSTT